MGTIIQAKCSCGYQTENMFIGAGMMNFKTECIFPVYCGSCKLMLQANLLEQTIKCSNCNGKVVSYNDELISKKSNGYGDFVWNITDNRTVRLTEDNNLCPRCQKFYLGFFSLGNWD